MSQHNFFKYIVVMAINFGSRTGFTVPPESIGTRPAKLILLCTEDNCVQAQKMNMRRDISVSGVYV